MCRGIQGQQHQEHGQQAAGRGVDHLQGTIRCPPLRRAWSLQSAPRWEAHIDSDAKGRNRPVWLSWPFRTPTGSTATAPGFPRPGGGRRAAAGGTVRGGDARQMIEAIYWPRALFMPASWYVTAVVPVSMVVAVRELACRGCWRGLVAAGAEVEARGGGYRGEPREPRGEPARPAGEREAGDSPVFRGYPIHHLGRFDAVRAIVRHHGAGGAHPVATRCLRPVGRALVAGLDRASALVPLEQSVDRFRGQRLQRAVPVHGEML